MSLKRGGSTLVGRDSTLEELRERVVSAVGLVDHEEEAMNDSRDRGTPGCTPEEERQEEEMEAEDEFTGYPLRLRENIVSAVLRMDGDDDDKMEKYGGGGVSKVSRRPTSRGGRSAGTSPVGGSSTGFIREEQEQQPGATAVTSTGTTERLTFRHDVFRRDSRSNLRISDEDLASFEASLSSTEENSVHRQSQQPPHDDEEGASPSLAEARLVVEEEENNGPNGGSIEDARPVIIDQASPRQQGTSLHQRITEGGKTTTRMVVNLAMVACLVLIVVSAVAIGLHQSSPKDTDGTTASTTTETGGNSPPSLPQHQPLPPMENLELLYFDLPEKTKNSLYNNETPQYQAWEWLLNHPKVTMFEEWRKKQIFAMATFFYSLEGPHWSDASPAHRRWMDLNTSECDWLLNDVEIAYLIQGATPVIGTPYDVQDLQTCNADGEIKTLLLHQLYLPTDANPFVPPEIGLLTSLRHIGVAYSDLGNAKLSDLIVPEMVRLPDLDIIHFHSCGASGTIPEDLGLLTGLRHLLIGDNPLTGSIPSAVAKMTSLEHFGVSNVETFTGTLPSELGLMTSLTGLWAYRSSIAGQIPSELGTLSHLRILILEGSMLSGPIPSQLGSMTSLSRLNLASSGLTGSIPSQLGLLTNGAWFTLGNDLEQLQDRADNNFVGSLPKELFLLSSMEVLSLPNLPKLYGSIPEEDIAMMHNLTIFNIGGSQLRGTLPEDICSIQILGFDCSDLLCGCDCPCL